MSACRQALEAQTDQALAHMAAVRRRHDPLTAVLLPVGREIAGAVRVQFPGRDKDNARVLATAAALLAGLEGQLTAEGTGPELVGMVLLDVLGYAAEDLNQDGSTR